MATAEHDCFCLMSNGLGLNGSKVKHFGHWHNGSESETQAGEL